MIPRLAILPILLVLAGCGRDAAQREPAAEPSAPAPALLLRGVVSSQATQPVILSVRGVLSQVPTNGQQVAKGDLLFEVEQETLEEDIEQALNRLGQINLDVSIHEITMRAAVSNQLGRAERYGRELALSEAVYAKAVSGLSPQEQELLELEIAQAELDLAEAEDALAREARLVKGGFVSPRALEALQRRAESARTAREEAQLRRQLALRPLPEDQRLKLDAERGQVRRRVERENESWEQERAALQRQLDLLLERRRDAEEAHARLVASRDGSRVESPADGVCQMRFRYDSGRGWMLPELGMGVWESDIIADIIDPSRMGIVLAVHETDASRIRVGQELRIHLPALPGQRFTGTVISRADLARDRTQMGMPGTDRIPTGQGWFSVQISFSAPGVALHPGMSANVELPHE